jgi:CBS domain-containing protein
LIAAFYEGLSDFAKQPRRYINSMKPQSVPTPQPHKRARQDSVALLETDDYVCVEPTAPLSQAIEVMKRDEGGCAIVCEGERVVGIFTERDFLNKIVGREVEFNSPVSQWMSPIVATLTPSATIGEAVAIMNEKSYRNIPLVENGKLVGSISVFDVISYLAESYPKAAMNLPPVSDQIMDSTEGA